MILWLYRAAWEPALWTLRLCAGLERLVGGTLWHARWKLAERLDPGASSETAPATLWLHAASLGECKGLWAFAQTLRKRPHSIGARILLTSNTTTGLDFLRARIEKEEERAEDVEEAEPSRFVARLAPFDHPRIVSRFLRTNRICAAVFFEVELWPHAIFAARKASVPVLWISARLTERARRRYAGNPLFAAALRRVLENIAWIQAQSPQEGDALRMFGGRDVEVGGDLRGLYYLQSDLQSRKTERAERVEVATRRGTAFVSLHADELTALIPKITAADTEPPIHIFPRKQNELARFVHALAPHGFVLHSQAPGAERVIVDSFGRVAETLARARTAVIGGSYGENDRIGGHNLWEPLLAGTRIEIGPHHANQKYLADKIKNGFANTSAFDFANEEILLNRAAARARERLVEAVNTR